MKEIQLLLIPESNEERLERQIQELKDQVDKVRKGQYAKIGALAKMYQETKFELETLKECICKGFK